MTLILSITHCTASLRAVVTDGISIGRPCCGAHNCSEPLASNRDRYCPMHWDKHKLCAVSQCRDIAPDGWRTCAIPGHRAYEDYRSAKNKAWFQLTRRLKRSNISQPPDPSDVGGILDADDDPDSEAESEQDVPKSDEGNRKVKARFGRRRTHNEQLIVCCCGVIAARATMYGAEAITGVAVRSALKRRA
jgi:hypothetical protein